MNPWIAHVKKVAAEKGLPYTEALKIAAESYRGKATTGAPSKTKVGEEDYTTKKTSKVYHEQGKYVKKATTPYTKYGKKKLIDFSKIHWGSFTKDWKDMGSSFETLYDFATDVLKRPKQYPPITVKRARFYKNIIMKGKGLGMCA